VAKIKLISMNRKAFHDFTVEETYEAGIVLVGCEVKSLRLNQCNLRDSYVLIKNGTASLVGMHIKAYEKAGYFSPEPVRERQLLLNKREIAQLRKNVEQRGYTIVPLKLYFSDALVKVELGLCRGKKLYDKRDSIKQKDVKRDIEREMKKNN